MPRALDVFLYAFVYAAQNFIKNPKILGAGNLSVRLVQGFWKSVIFANFFTFFALRILIRLRSRNARLHQKSQNTWCGQAECLVRSRLLEICDFCEFACFARLTYSYTPAHETHDFIKNPKILGAGELSVRLVRFQAVWRGKLDVRLVQLDFLSITNKRWVAATCGNPLLN